MSKRQKIIVSVTGIFLVLLLLVGLTYAYFLTRINGNTNEKSISVSTANLVLEYGENTNVVQGINNAEPGYSVEKIFTATNKGNSTVTYGAALESIVNGLSRQQDLVYTLTCTSYLKSGFSLASNGTITGTVDGTCNGVPTEKQFPSTSTMSVMTTNTIDTTHTHAYKLTVTYKEMSVDQSTDMNKTFSAKVNIVDLRANADKINPYSANKNTLSYQIVNNALKGGTNKTIFGNEVTTFTSISGENERVLNTAPDDYGISYYYRGAVKDNYVKFAGFTWRIVRINGDGSIRLILDGTLEKVKREGSNAFAGSTYAFNSSYNDNAYVGYMYGLAASTTDTNRCLKLNGTTVENVISTYGTKETCEANNGTWTTTAYEATHANIADSTIKTAVDTFYETYIENNTNNYHYEKYLADTLFCGDKTLANSSIGSSNTALGYGTNKTYYAASERLYHLATTTEAIPTLKCAEEANNTYSRYTVKVNNTIKGVSTNGNLTYPIALLTADELVMAGAFAVDHKITYYLTDAYLNGNSNSAFYTMTPHNASSEAVNFFTHAVYYSLNAASVVLRGAIRPVINLRADILVGGGDGTSSNPYTVKLS